MGEIQQDIPIRFQTGHRHIIQVAQREPDIASGVVNPKHIIELLDKCPNSPGAEFQQSNKSRSHLRYEIETIEMCISLRRQPALSATNERA